ncbi:MAG: hypothetical protein ACFFC3_10785 [Candidatus Odinarchaeota archaeon]
MSEILQGEIKTIRSKKSQFMIELEGGVIFRALSSVLSLILSGLINNSRIQALCIA